MFHSSGVPTDSELRAPALCHTVIQPLSVWCDKGRFRAILLVYLNGLKHVSSVRLGKDLMVTLYQRIEDAITIVLRLLGRIGPGVYWSVITNDPSTTILFQWMPSICAPY